MFATESKNTIYIGVSLIMLAAVLTFALFFMQLRNDMAAARNSEIQAAQTAQNYREFNKYNGALLYGEDVIEAIRMYAGSSVEVYVNRVNNSGSSFHMTMESVATNPDSVKVATLQNKFSPEYKYTAYLAFDFEDVSNVHSISEVTAASNVTGIAFICEGRR